MRVLVISNLYPPDVLGGYEMGCQQAADGLRAAGHDVRVLAAPRSGVGPDDPPHVVRRLRLADVYDPYAMHKVGPAGRAARQVEACGVQAFNVHVLCREVEEFRPDVAYVWNVIGLGGLGLLAGLQHLGVPWVMHLMDDVPRTLCAVALGDGPPVPAVADAFHRLCRGRFICCSRTTLDEIESAGVRIAGRTAIIPNWVTTAGSPRRTVYRPGGHLRCMTAGTICGHKGSDIVIRATEQLRDRGHADFSVHMYGWDSDPGFRTMIQSARLDMVRIMGARGREELDELYPEYDVFLFPTWAREPFGFAPLEAMAHGCLVVMSNLSGVSERVVGGVDCVKVDRTPAAVADAVEGVLRGDTPLAEIGRRASRTVLRFFPLSVILPRIEAELAAAARAGGGDRRPAAEVHRVALLAEKMFQALVHETTAA